ncbi:MAG: VWA domain-containing protein [Thermoplasmata archaeon]|nr:MAG: VWA domain-containing protein [Thermoplasmata archaeon]
MAAALFVTVVPLLCATSYFMSSAMARPYIDIDKDAEPDSIWPAGSENEPNRAEVTLTLRALGEPAAAIDMVFVMDSSGSMGASDPNYIRVSATQNVVDKMLNPDRAAVVNFASNATLVTDYAGHLSTDYRGIKKNLAQITSGAGTNIDDAIHVSVKELEDYGDPLKTRLVIMLTDGKPDAPGHPTNGNVTSGTMGLARNNNITIYTVGLGSDQDADLLRWIADSTNGTYYSAQNASELLQIYEDISNRYLTRVAGRNIEVVEILPRYVDLIPGSFSNSSVQIESDSDGETALRWNISRLLLTESWNVTYEIESSQRGELHIGVYPESGINYTTWDYKDDFIPFEDVSIYVVLPPPVPPPPPPPPPPPHAVPPHPLEFFPMPSPPVSAGMLSQVSLSQIGQPAGWQALFAPFAALSLKEISKVKSLGIRVGIENRLASVKAEIAARRASKRWFRSI